MRNTLFIDCCFLDECEFHINLVVCLEVTNEQKVNLGFFSSCA